jgi:hypothetical protein
MRPVGDGEEGPPPGRVSVVIPCFNYAPYLEDAVDSALAQRGAVVDVVIVDDASTDGSWQVAQRLEQASGRVTALRHTANRGPVATFNDGVAAATGDFIIRLDADDLLTPGSVARGLALFHAFPSVGLVYGHPVHFSGTPAPGYRGRCRSWSVWPGAAWLARRCAAAVNVITAPEAMMRASALDAAGPFQRELRHTHDFELWLRLAAVSDVGHVDGADQAWHRIHPGSLSSSVAPLEDLGERRAAFDALFGHGSPRIDNGAELAAQAKTALAREAVTLACREYDRGRGELAVAAGFVQAARELVPDPTGLHGWSGLERRMRGRQPGRTLSLLPRLSRRVRTQLRAAAWRYRGVM